MIRKLVFVGISIFPFLASLGQINLQSGTTLTISQGTVVNFNGISADSIVIPANANLINNGEIWFGDSTEIFEAPGFPVTGDGFEAVNVPPGIVTSHPGNLGLEWLTPTNTSGFIVQRRHKPLFDSVGTYSVSRSYSFSPDLNLNQVELRFHYDQTELGTLNENTLQLYNRDPFNQWLNLGGQVDPSLNYVTADNVSEANVLTLFDVPNVDVREHNLLEVHWYPNPAKDHVQIRTALWPLEVSITDITGRKVHKATVNDQNSRLDLSGFSSGTYLMSFTAESFRFDHVLIVQ